MSIFLGVVTIIFTYLPLYFDNFISFTTACSYQTQPAQYTAGDSLFGEITFDRTKGNANLLVPSNCAWKGNGSAGSRYLIEFTYVDTGMFSLIFAKLYTAHLQFIDIIV